MLYFSQNNPRGLSFKVSWSILTGFQEDHLAFEYFKLSDLLSKRWLNSLEAHASEHVSTV